MSCSFWAITSYFNPVGYQRRLANYRVFRKFVKLPLLTVEWSSTGEFELRRDDANILIQLAGGDVMWQKERLLNIALRKLPADCDLVAWLDCDIVFGRVDWIELAREALDRYQAVQLFTTVHYAPDHLVPADVCPESLAAVPPILTGDSLASQIVGDSRRIQEIEKHFRGQNDGLAWAASRELLQKHGFYDARIVGGGGMGIAKAACGRYAEYVEERSLGPSQTAHYLAWAVPYSESVNGSISFIDCRVYHLWHGDLSDRQYRVRQSKLNEYDFDPYNDITIGDNGCWHWNTDKPELHQYLQSYFAARREDGVEIA